jgi:hypothetical protein
MPKLSDDMYSFLKNSFVWSLELAQKNNVRFKFLTAFFSELAQKNNVRFKFLTAFFSVIL